MTAVLALAEVADDKGAEAEEAVLGAVLLDDAALDVASAIIEPRRFAGAKRRLIYEAMLRLRDRGSVVDTVTLAAEIGQPQAFKAVGGHEYLSVLASVVPTAANVSYYAKLVLENSQRRRLARLGSDIVREADSGKMAPADIRAVFKALLETDESRSADSTRPFRLYAAGELDALPPAEWIVSNSVPQNAIVGVIGAKGQKKTFAVLDLALHIATGREWHGRAVKQGAVVYVYAEGPFGAKSRIESWCQHQGVDRRALPLWLLPTRLPMNDPAAVASLLCEIEALAECPVLVVIDTLNQNLDGDEDGTGMGGFVRGCAMLRDRIGACVMAVHHTPLGNDERGRGHSSFDGALDTRLMVSCDAERVTIECTHQRNAADGWAVAFEAIPVAGSLVLIPSAPDGGQLKGQRRELLSVLHAQGTLTFSGWLAATALGRSSFQKARRWLVARAYVKQEGKQYACTVSGADALGAPRALGGAS